MELVPGNHRWSQLSVGNGHKCGRTLNSEGEAKGWGMGGAADCGMLKPVDRLLQADSSMC